MPTRRGQFPAVVEVFIMEFTFEIQKQESGCRVQSDRRYPLSLLLLSDRQLRKRDPSQTLWSLLWRSRLLRILFACVHFSDSDKNVTICHYYHCCLLWPIWCPTWINCYGRPFSVATFIWCALFTPVAPFNVKDQKDPLILFPYWSMNRRPSYLRSPQQEKQNKTVSPSPPDMLRGNDQ